MSLHLDLKPHRLPTPQMADSQLGPRRSMIRHPLLHIPHDMLMLLWNRSAKRQDFVHLRPPLGTGVLQGVLDVRKGLVDLRGNVLGKGGAIGQGLGYITLCMVPSTC